MDIAQQIRTFTGGEWAPILATREDLEKYFTACLICRNAIPAPQGGVDNRAGLWYLSPTKNSGLTNPQAKLWTFIYSYQQAYGLVFENQ